MRMWFRGPHPLPLSQFWEKGRQSFLSYDLSNQILISYS